MGGEDGGVGHRQQRRGVDDDHALHREPVEDGAHGLGAEQLARVGRHAAGGEDGELGEVGMLLQHVLDACPADQDVGEAGTLDQTQVLGDGRPSQVAVDQRDRLS